MTENHFDLAAALLSDAADLVGHALHVTHTIAEHAYGALQLVATHSSTPDDTHTTVVWAAVDDHVLAAVEAITDSHTATPAARIIAFRAAGLVFAARTPLTFTAHGRHTYTLAAAVGADTWTLTIDDTTTPHRSPLADALDAISGTYETSCAAG